MTHTPSPLGSNYPQIVYLDSLKGESPYGVPIDDSQELEMLVTEAQKYTGLSFEEKLLKVKELVLRATPLNAWEVSRTGSSDELRGRCTDLVFNAHPLSDALRAQAGCCRYIAVLFFILGAHAQLGARHFLNSHRISPQLATCFNTVMQGDRVENISLFAETIQDPKNSYVKNIELVFKRPVLFCKDELFYAYHLVDKKIQLIKTRDQHFIPKQPENLVFV